MKKTLIGLTLALVVTAGTLMAGGDGCCGNAKTDGAANDKAACPAKDQASCPAKTDTTKAQKDGTAVKDAKDEKAPAKDTTLVKK